MTPGTGSGPRSGDEEGSDSRAADGDSSSEDPDGSGPGSRVADGGDPTPGDADRPNVVLFVMDTTRAAETVPADPAVTPTLATLAERGTEYTRAFSAAPWTLPSHASIFTGTYPTRHGAHGNHTRLEDGLPTLAELFGSAGYETAAFSNNVWITGEFGFDRGFDTFRENHELTNGSYDHPDEIRGSYRLPGERDPWWRDPGALEARLTEWMAPGGRGGSLVDAVGRWVPGLARPSPDDGVERTLDWVRRWLETRSGPEPFFLFVNCIEPHLEYRPPREHARRFLPEGWSYGDAMEVPQDPRAYDAGLFDLSAEEWSVLRALYRAEIAYLDERLAALGDALEAAGEWEDTVVLVTSDHGENVGEHGLLGHQYSLHDTLVHVPLVVRGGPFEGGLPGSDALVQSVDLAPTLLDVAGIEASDAREGFQGRSFHPSADRDRRSKVFAEYVGPRPPVEVLEERFGDLPDRVYDLQRSLRAVRTERFKYVRASDGSRWLYDVVDDPGETTDLVDEAPERAAELEAKLDRWASSFEGPRASGNVPVAPETEKRLSELGYL